MESITLIVILLSFTGVNADCSTNKDCGSCIADYENWWDYWGCRWCPLTQECHAPGSIYNACKDDHQVTDDSTLSCESVADPSILSYSSQTAETMAKWSSLAYVTPAAKDKNSMQSVVQSEFGSNYRILEFLMNDCDVILEYRDCGAVIAVSDVDNHLVVAFRGTFETTQLVEQVLGVLTGMTDSPIGGEVLRYNENTHDSMYPCIKSLVDELVIDNPSLRISVTGHSLGGAQATLIASHLLFDGVVSPSKLDLYTFGAPRVGDRDFAYEFDRLMGNSWRITRSEDPVVQAVPRSLAGLYFAYHTRREVFYQTMDTFTSASSFKTCNGNEDDACIDGEDLCIASSCIDAHNDYFFSDLPRYIQDKISSGVPAPQTNRDQCRSFHYSD